MKNFFSWLMLGFTVLLVNDVNGQLLYTTVGNSGEGVVRQINLDGTGNVTININGLATASDAQYSNNGRLIGVSGKTFTQTQQGQISSNVFTYDPATNQTRQITSFIDNFFPSNGTRLFTNAVFKSFSPDGSALAVVGHTLFITPAGPGGDPPSQGLDGRTLTVFRVSDGAQLSQQVMDPNFNGTSSAGAGLSWSPVEDLIAVPVSTSSGNPLASGPTPIVGFNSSGQFLRNLTFPSGGINQQVIEHDMFPSFSPNGVALAYFRSTRFGLSANPSLLDLRISSPAGDRSILSFTPGQLPAGLSWSPDGTQIAFGVGAQPVFFGVQLGYEVDPATASIGIVNVDGSSPTPFLSAPVATPEFFPGTPSAGTPGDVNMDGSISFLDISPFIAILSAGDFQAEADIDQSGAVNFLDIAPFIALLSGQ